MEGEKVTNSSSFEMLFSGLLLLLDDLVPKKHQPTPKRTKRTKQKTRNLTTPSLQ